MLVHRIGQKKYLEITGKVSEFQNEKLVDTLLMFNAAAVAARQYFGLGNKNTWFLTSISNGMIYHNLIGAIIATERYLIDD